MPTSIPMIFYALIANASVGAMFLGGLVPAGLMAPSLMVVIAIIARRRDFPREPRSSWAQTPAILGRALPPLALPGILARLDLFRHHHAHRSRGDRGELRARCSRSSSIARCGSPVAARSSPTRCGPRP